MTIPQEQFDDLLSRTGLAAPFYYPVIAVDDAGYNVERDIPYCKRPLNTYTVPARTLFAAGTLWNQFSVFQRPHVSVLYRGL